MPTKESGRLVLHKDFSSKFVDKRNISVWLPHGYDTSTESYAVLYTHDGQNMFALDTSSQNQKWEIDSVLTQLSQKKSVKNTIVVGIWNTYKRRSEYLPQDIEKYVEKEVQINLQNIKESPPIANNYVNFFVEELKPFIDKTYRTKTDQANTFMMGSSMGGLITLYTHTQHPKLFGAIACLSTHWPMDHYLKVSRPGNGDELAEAFYQYLVDKLPGGDSKTKIYFDYGTETLDAYYEPYQLKVDELMRKKGYSFNKNWMSKKFEGHLHHESSWNERLHIPLEFILAI